MPLSPPLAEPTSAVAAKCRATLMLGSAGQAAFPFAPAAAILLAMVPLSLGPLRPNAAQAASGASVPAEESCSARAILRDRVASIGERLELNLAGGATLKIVGVDPPRPTPTDPDLDAKARDQLAGWLANQDVFYRPLDNRPDRWGRLPAFVFAPDGGPGSAALLPVAQTILDAGLARFEPSPEAKPCKAALLAAEDAARKAELGLWADPYYAIAKATDHEAFAEKAGTSIIVEGQVTGVEAGSFGLALLFGPRRGRDFSVVILQRNIKSFDLIGLKLADLPGTTVRVRGLLELRFGPQIEILSPDELEIIKQNPSQPPGSISRQR